MPITTIRLFSSKSDIFLHLVCIIFLLFYCMVIYRTCHRQLLLHTLQLFNNLSFIIQEFIRQIEIFRSWLLLFDDDLISDLSRFPVQYIDTVRKQYCFVNIMRDKKCCKINVLHYFQIPLMDCTFRDRIKCTERLVQKCHSLR